MRGDVQIVMAQALAITSRGQPLSGMCVAQAWRSRWGCMGWSPRIFVIPNSIRDTLRTLIDGSLWPAYRFRTAKNNASDFALARLMTFERFAR